MSCPTARRRLASVTCWTATRCAAAGTAARHPGVGGANRALAVVTGDAGRRWQAVTLPAALSTPTQVVCTAAGVCLAGRLVGQRLHPGAGPGQHVRHPGGSGLPSARPLYGGVEVQGPGRGGAAAPFPLALTTTTDGGTSWVSSSVDNGKAQSQPGLSCPTTSTCQLVAADGLYRSSDGGASWARRRLPSPSGSPDTTAVSVSCPDVEPAWSSASAVKGRA